jgi:hypothetical protein
MALFVVWSGCATSGKIAHLRLGMSEDSVLEVMGDPTSVSEAPGIRFLNYGLFETSDNRILNRPSPYYVMIQDGKVRAFGRQGDFNTTAMPVQRIQIEQVSK